MYCTHFIDVGLGICVGLRQCEKCEIAKWCHLLECVIRQPQSRPRHAPHGTERTALLLEYFLVSFKISRTKRGVLINFYEGQRNPRLCLISLGKEKYDQAFVVSSLLKLISGYNRWRDPSGSITRDSSNLMTQHDSSAKPPWSLRLPQTDALPEKK